MNTHRPQDLADALAWNEPTQARSRARVEAILDAMRDLAVEAGHLDIGLTDVAKQAGIPIGSVYQYFPTKTALLGQLFHREMEPVDALIRGSFEKIASMDDLIEGLGQMLTTVADLVRSRPGLSVIWSTPAMDPVLQLADLENSRKNADLIAGAVRHFVADGADQEAIWSSSMLICHLWGSVIRLGVLLDDSESRHSVVSQYAAMIEDHLRAVAQTSD